MQLKEDYKIVTYNINSDMIINIEDLMIGLLMTNFDDFVEYALMYVGYLCYCSMNNINFE